VLVHTPIVLALLKYLIDMRNAHSRTSGCIRLVGSRSSAYAFGHKDGKVAQGFSRILGQADQCSRRVSFAGSAVTPLQGSVEAFDQSQSVEGLGQETNCSGLYRSRTDGLFREGCDENEWHVVPPGEQEGLQLDAAHGRHLDVRNHAGRVVEAGRLQELLGRRKCMDGVSERPQEVVSCDPNRSIIIDDRNHRGAGHNVFPSGRDGGPIAAPL
jgi:hypothetical protein